MRLISYSCGSRTSSTNTSSPRSQRAFSSSDGDLLRRVRSPAGVGAVELRRRHAAELLVVDQRRDGRVRAAHRAVRILAQLQLAELHPQRVEQQEPADQRLADAEDQLERLGRLDQPMMPGSTPSTPPSAQLGTRPGGGGSG